MDIFGILSWSETVALYLPSGLMVYISTEFCVLASFTNDSFCRADIFLGQ